MKNLTIRNIPDDLYQIIGRIARRNRRSIQQQLLVQLERLRIMDNESPVTRAAGIRKRLAGRPLGDTVIMAPELLFAEAAQVLLKNEKAGYLQNDEADEILSSIMELPIERVSHYDLLPDALVVARQYNLTIYDALFLALAKNRHARLISGDRHLVKTFAAI